VVVVAVVEENEGDEEGEDLFLFGTLTWSPVGTP